MHRLIVSSTALAWCVASVLSAVCNQTQFDLAYTASVSSSCGRSMFGSASAADKFPPILTMLTSGIALDGLCVNNCLNDLYSVYMMYPPCCPYTNTPATQLPCAGPLLIGNFLIACNLDYGIMPTADGSACVNNDYALMAKLELQDIDSACFATMPSSDTARRAADFASWGMANNASFCQRGPLESKSPCVVATSRLVQQFPNCTDDVDDNVKSTLVSELNLVCSAFSSALSLCCCFHIGLLVVVLVESLYWL
ncbi:Aste57867_9419 [Aphanomyces stellatus]|uniref:Aste57867_9419 protein n=1 Tax=Aphanomyces stellatus TaxID=120398 RepID=A0A485KMU2_9STRA|nr:hypothetical protein As57867_009383 [Aphanomyces stellatus]VFT86299.1 Aste57867_9419 [Aphanomyces stellatus]